MLDLTENTYVWTGSTWQRSDLNGWLLTQADKVNDARWIVGYAKKNGNTYSVLLAPRYP